MTHAVLSAEDYARVRVAAERCERGFLSDQQRQALSNLVVLSANTDDLPTPVSAAVFAAVEMLARGVGDPS